MMTTRLFVRHPKHYLFILLALCAVVLFFNLSVNPGGSILHILKDSPDPVRAVQPDSGMIQTLEKAVAVNVTRDLDPGTLRVLFWTPWFFDRWWFLPETSLLTCGGVQCQYTHDKSMYDVSHAVVFHLFHRSFDPNEARKPQCMPSHRDPEQYWIIHNVDPPSISIRTDITQLNDLFNLSATYHSQADMLMPYGYCQQTSKGETLQSNYATGKTGLVSWLVSHCNTHSGRENYVKELQNYVTVDIYGACADFGSKGMLCKDKLFMDQRDCQESLDTINSYKFYMAFENTVCVDYITEKTYKILEPGMRTVPIVYGGGTQVHKLLPTHSYIDAAAYDSPAALAEYLQVLDKDDALYNQYFTWRTKYTCRLSSLPCAFCQEFHRVYGRQNTLVKDIPAIFSPEKNCAASADTYKKLKKTKFIGCRSELSDGKDNIP